MAIPSKQDDTKDNKKSIVETAKKRFQFAVDATQDERNLGDEDIKFIAGDQWPEEIKTARKEDKRPVLTINRAPQMVRNVTNDQRLNHPEIKVFPVDDKADPLTAKILKGLIRHIENDSNAEEAYNTAYDNAVKRSYGFWRIITKYESPTSFRQKILIERIRNPNRVLLDPTHQEKDARDMNWGFIWDDILHDDYNEEYPESELAQTSDWQIHINSNPAWFNEKTCRVVEYFCKEYEDDTLILLSNGEAVLKRYVEKVLTDYAARGELVTPTDKSRPTKVPVIKWYKLNGIEILEENIFPGQYIPILPVYGEEHDINGKVIRESVIRHSKDSQRIYNYYKSTETETITLAPKAPWIVAEGQIVGPNVQKWKAANFRTFPYLEYKPVSHEDQLVPAPQRQAYEPPIQALTQASMLASEDIKNTSGVTDAAMGNRSNEQSGIAINSRAQQAQRNNFHFMDNLNLSIKHTGRILVDIIPIVYDMPQAVRILGEDGEGEIVRINEMFNYKGEMKKFDFSIGQYDVVCEEGPGFATKRQESQASMLELSKVSPQIMNAAPDLIVKNMDWQGASDIAERLRKTLPPGLVDDPEQKPLPPQVQAQMQQMDQMIQQLTEQLNKQNELVNTKRMELESKERVENAKLKNNLDIEMLKMQGQATLEIYSAEIKNINRRLALLDQYQPINDDFNDLESDQFVDPTNQQPTGGASPGNLME
ncbi:MAG: hypothetical protein JNL11_17475 [Bdellovibrionaceae bacterium]|nr:hypothetical protein [Pseudobdellovibrionaceae bacterium]